MSMYLRSISAIVGSLLLAITCYGSETQGHSSDASLSQLAARLTARTHVLAIAMRPGTEDLRALAYFREERGAKVSTAYLTDGEAGESDVEGLFPRQLAAVRREEAVRAMTVLGGEAIFLNFPDIVAAPSDSAVQDLWPADSVQDALVRIILQKKPDVVILSADRFVGSKQRWHTILERVVRSAVERAGGLSVAGRWEVDRLVIASGSSKGIPLANRTGGDKSNAARLLQQSALEAYVSLHMQQKQWNSSDNILYTKVTSRSIPRLGSCDQGLPGRIPARLARLSPRIEKLAADVRSARVDRKRSLTIATVLADSLNAILLRDYLLTVREKRDALSWKQGLEDIRNDLLGVSASYRFSEKIVTGRQLLFLTIDSLSKAFDEGSTDLYVPGVDQGWILDEGQIPKLPLVVGKSYNLISPNFFEYDLPYPDEGLNRQSVGHPLYVFLVHKSGVREKSFSHRIIYPLLYAPRFTTEVLTPIVAHRPGEELRLRLTNHSRDGVKDAVHVRDSLVTAPPMEFSLAEKEAAQLLTLKLEWNAKPQEGTYTSSVLIGDQHVARFAHRTFPLSVDSSRRVVLITGLAHSPMVTALKRLSVNLEGVIPPDSSLAQIDSSVVLVLDRRALDFATAPTKLAQECMAFAQRGGHVVICTQEPALWNSTSLTTLLSVGNTPSLDPSMSVHVDPTSPLCIAPNVLTAADFQGYLFRLNSTAIGLPKQVASGAMIIRTISGIPILVSLPVGNGRITYVGLALETQILNVHPGVHRLLANIISLPDGGTHR
jgi:LmbE family N-acetylglucosaminyl deacetylase